VIYLSTTAVYGDTGGKAIDETYQTHPQSDRAINRLKAENAWVDLAKKFDVTYDILRLSGIYGNERNQLINLVKGTAKRIIKEGHVFNRIHVEDIAEILMLSLKQFNSGQILNISDDYPCSNEEIAKYAASLMKMDIPKKIQPKEIKSEMLKEFYKDSKKVSNKKMRKFFNYNLKYPTFKEGLNMIKNHII